MPPKNKGTKSAKPARAKTPILIDGLTKDEMTKEQLEEHIVRLREELDREREERNYFQLERDKIRSFCEITERQLEEAQAERKNLDKETENDEGRHQVEVKVYKQKMKHLLCEHQNTICELKADDETSTTTAQKEQERLENELHRRMGSLRVDMQELDNESLIHELELKHNEEMTKTRNSWDQKLIEFQAEQDKKVELRQKELDNMRENETKEKTDFWSSHITTLINDHDAVFSDLNTLIKGMEQDLDINHSLKEKIQSMKVKQKETDLPEVLQSNKCLRDHLSEVKKEIEDLGKIKFCTQKKDPSERVKLKELTDRKKEYAELERKFSELQLERDELNKTIPQNVQQVQHNADLKVAQLEKKLKVVTENLEKTQAHLSFVLSVFNMDQTALGGITKKIEEDIDFSNDSIKNMQYKRAKISKARKELMLFYEAKQRALGIPVEELHIKPFERVWNQAY